MAVAEKAFYTTEEVARMLDMSKATIMRKVQAGEIPAKKFGRLWRFPRQRVDAWLERGLPPVEPAEAVTEETDYELDAETRAWLEADLAGDLPPYEWGEVDPLSVGRPVRYVAGEGLVIEEGSSEKT